MIFHACWVQFSAKCVLIAWQTDASEWHDTLLWITWRPACRFCTCADVQRGSPRVSAFVWLSFVFCLSAVSEGWRQRPAEENWRWHPAVWSRWSGFRRRSSRLLSLGATSSPVSLRSTCVHGCEGRLMLVLRERVSVCPVHNISE